ncbi:hypothetical protein D3C87_995040 [compost metagenome]
MVASLMLAVGVSVAVQVTPPSLLVRFASVPLATLMSDRSKPLTASLKVIVTVVVSPMPRRLSATTMVAVGNAVSMAKLFESVVPTPLLPEALVTPLLSRVIRLLVSVMLAVGVSVAVQVMPPSLDATLLKVPLAMVRSALLKPLTASLKVMVTVEVSPALSAVSATTMVAVGTSVCTA